MKTRKGHNVYPITVAQKFHLYYAKYCPNMAVLNIGTSLTIGTELDWNVLRDSINYAYARNEAMRIRFTRDKDGECYQYIADVDEDFKERTVDFKDFTDVTMEEAENEMQGWTQVPFEFEDSPMTKIVMIKMPDGFNGVYFLGHHMVVDAQSLIAFLKDIIEIYCNAMYEGVPFPKDMCSYIEQLKKDLAYEAGSKAQLRDREFFEKLIRQSEPIYNGIDGTAKLDAARELMHDNKLRSAFNASDDVTSALDIFHLEAEPTKRLMDFCEKYHISLACLLLMGIRTFFQKENGFDDVSVTMPSPDVRHLRRRSQAAHVFIRFRLGRAFQRMYALLMPCIPSGISKTSCSAMQTTTRQSTLHCAQRPIRSQRQGLHMSRCRLHISL